MKLFGLILVIVGLVLGGLVIWAFAGRSQTNNFVVLGGLVTVTMIALGLLILSDPDRRRR